ncbi:MAG: Hsp70 family protein, partial [Proteobacteria bacterium]|nr:Hsp70 family protein [Pseudomonadota bacterium]
QKLIDAAITAKIALSMVDQQDVIVADVLPGKHMEIAVSRREFEDCICQYVDKIKGIIDGLWDTSRKKPGDVDRVIKVGGSSLMPCMGMLLTEMVGEGKVYGNIDPSLSVASGAAIYAAYLDDRSVFNREIEIQQITSHSLGVETSGERFHILIPKNRKTPCEVKEVFGTELDNETSLNINIYQGSASLVKDNSLIGTISISGLPPKPKGQLDIEITFKVSEDNTLSAIAEVEGKRKTATFKFG